MKRERHTPDCLYCVGFNTGKPVKKARSLRWKEEAKYFCNYDHAVLWSLAVLAKTSMKWDAVKRRWVKEEKKPVAHSVVMPPAVAKDRALP